MTDAEEREADIQQLRMIEEYERERAAEEKLEVQVFY